MSRSLDESTSARDDASETRGNGDDVAREGDTAPVQQRLSVTPAAAISPVAQLRAMGREQFIERSREVASVILLRISDDFGDRRPTGELGSDYLQAWYQLQEAMVDRETPDGALVADPRDTHPEDAPVRLRLAVGWPKAKVLEEPFRIPRVLWARIEHYLSRETKDFIRLVRQKMLLEACIRQIDADVHAELAELGIDLDKQLFGEE